jgi:putative PIN family toxin of toxin-antitoxin system
LRVVVDTNVLISGAFYTGPALTILESFIEGEFQLALSPEILTECRRVGNGFSRTRSNTNFERLLSLLLAQALIVEAPVLDQQICRDPHDDKFIACALAVGAGVIVSGDKDLLSISGTFDMLIITPREFVNSYIRRGR